MPVVKISAELKRKCDTPKQLPSIDDYQSTELWFRELLKDVAAAHEVYAICYQRQGALSDAVERRGL